MPIASTPPSPTNAPSLPLQDPTPKPHALPPHEQPTTTSEYSMSFLTTLMETYATLSQMVVELEQDKHTQALEILQLKKRVHKLEKKKRPKMHPNRGKIEAIDVDEGITLVDVETQEEVVTIDAEPRGRINQEEVVAMDVEPQERINQDNVNAASKGVSAAEPTVFDDEEITQKLHDEEFLKATARDNQEKVDMERALKLQRQYDDKEENIDWNVVAKQIQERHLDNIKKYQNLKMKPVSIAQAKKNMIIYLKNMTLFKPDKDVEEPKKKRVTDETLLQESFKKLRAAKVSGSESTQEIPSTVPKEMSEEDVHNMLEIVLVFKFNVEALQVKYPIIYWEIHTDGSRTYWKIIRVGGITEAYLSF
uniref:Uncharacterized protein n=1 Tax=Tanacetum cinerariifolium TaxID=118510 RepID=A0A699JMJ3_TANCI|nr:hypothetical protein [Tanacetum cinerariifolium]